MIKQALIEYVDPELNKLRIFPEGPMWPENFLKTFSPLNRLNEIDESDIYPFRLASHLGLLLDIRLINPQKYSKLRRKIK